MVENYYKHCYSENEYMLYVEALKRSCLAPKTCIFNDSTLELNYMSQKYGEGFMLNGAQNKDPGLRRIL
jgi:hypothetical protein